MKVATGAFSALAAARPAVWIRSRYARTPWDCDQAFLQCSSRTGTTGWPEGSLHQAPSRAWASQ